MAISFECDYCGREIYQDDWVKFNAEERSPGVSSRALNRMGLGDLDRSSRFDFHLHCFRDITRIMKDRRRWAQGAADGTGLEWRLEECDEYRRPAVVKPIYRNRILQLCREKDIDRDELAERLGTSRGAVGRWLKSYVTDRGRPVGITAQWIKRLQMFFDLDSRDDLFESEATGDAPAAEFVRAS